MQLSGISRDLFCENMYFTKKDNPPFFLFQRIFQTQPAEEMRFRSFFYVTNVHGMQNESFAKGNRSVPKR